jgi:Tfp pilus assembly protein PilV
MNIKPRYLSRSSGFSLVEAVMSSLIVAGMLLAALNSVAAAKKAEQNNVDRVRGTHLAQALVAEILSLEYAEPDGGTTLAKDSGETTRNTFDDVDDYNGWTESPPSNINGVALVGMTSWSTSVVVNWATADTYALGTSRSGAKKITVTVRCNGRLVATTDAIRTDTR